MKLEDLAHLPVLNEGQLETAAVKEYAKITLQIPFGNEKEVTDVYQVVGKGTIDRAPKDLSPVLYIRRHNLGTDDVDIPKVYQVFIDNIIEYQPLVPKEK